MFKDLGISRFTEQFPVSENKLAYSLLATSVACMLGAILAENTTIQITSMFGSIATAALSIVRFATSSKNSSV